MHQSRGSKTKLIEGQKVTTIQDFKKTEFIDQVLNKHSISMQSPTKTAIYWQNRIMDEGYTKSLHYEMKESLSKKMHVNIAFGGSLGSYVDFEKFLKDDKKASAKEKILAKKGKHPLFATEEEVRQFYYDKDKGTKAPVMPNNYDKLGTVAEDTFEELRNKNIISPIITRDELIILVKKERGRLLTPAMAEKYCNEINDKIVEWHMKTFLEKGTHDDQLLKSAKKEVTHYSKQHKLSFEQTNEIGQKMEMMAKKIEPVVGKQIGKMATKNKTSIGDDLLNLIQIGCNIYKIPTEEGLNFLINRLKRK